MNTSKIKVSVIVPTYNEEKNIGKCLESLSDQNFSGFEVIGVDDGWTDSTLSVMSNVQYQMTNVKLLKQRHLGPAVARNKAARESEGEILVFVDADMTFSKEF